MTENKTFKRRVRDRMSKTGESYTAARAQVARKSERVTAAKTRLATAATMPVSEDKLKDATGKTWDQWLALLEQWGARDKKHGEVAEYLVAKHGVAGWYAQAITVGFERATGMRIKHQQADGFTISASKTIAVPLEALFDAFVNTRMRKKWLSDGTMSLRTSQPGRSARFNWEDGSTRVNVSFVAKGPEKSTVYVSHERLPDADEAETTKAQWKERLGGLRSFLER